MESVCLATNNLYVLKKQSQKLPEVISEHVDFSGGACPQTPLQPCALHAFTSHTNIYTPAIYTAERDHASLTPSISDTSPICTGLVPWLKHKCLQYRVQQICSEKIHSYNPTLQSTIVYTNMLTDLHSSAYIPMYKVMQYLHKDMCAVTIAMVRSQYSFLFLMT